MAHPKRRQLAEDLADRLNCDVVYDERNNEWDTGRRALLAFDPEATHHLVLQDDAVVCEGLTLGLEEALRFVPKRSPVSLYVGRRRPHSNLLPEATRKADELGASWLVMRDLNWGVGVCIPTSVIPEVVTEADQMTCPEYDVRVSAYFARRGTPVYYTWPSLVDHRDSESLLAGRANEGRVAYRFLGDESALAVDWSGPAVEVGPMEPVTAFRNERGRVVTVRADSGTAKRYRKRSHWTELI